jgi:hypothetical protein
LREEIKLKVVRPPSLNNLEVGTGRQRSEALASSCSFVACREVFNVFALVDQAKLLESREWREIND